MAYVITDDCTACARCPQVCPNSAIAAALVWRPAAIELRSYRIDPRLCTECVGFADDPQCAEVCPAGAIVLEGVRPARIL